MSSKLLVAILPDGDASEVSRALIAGGFGVTRVNTAGGFLRRGNATLLVGVDAERLDGAIAVMQASAAQSGGQGGPLFVLPVETTVRM
jgi:uncharacterized protein YaaQ